LYHHLSGAPFKQGSAPDLRVCHPRPHRFEVELDLADWSERLTYVCGCYYDIEGTAVLCELLRSGDTVIDVGANVGFLTLVAAATVGPSGRVISFEPNERLARRLRGTLQRNNLRNVVVHTVALGDADGTRFLEVGDHSGTATLRRSATAGEAVKVRRGDTILIDLQQGAPVLLKVDVEGFEERVLLGLDRFLSAGRVLVLVEVTDSWLREDGSSAKSLFDLMRHYRMAAMRPHVDPLSRLRLFPLDGPMDSLFQYDVLFVPPDHVWLERVRQHAR
jgi:FkbM family methyltransferase